MQQWKSEAGPIDNDLGTYLSFKLRFIECLYLLRAKIKATNEYQLIENTQGPEQADPHEAHTMQAALYTWVIGLVDEGADGVNVFRLAKNKFPQEADEIKLYQRKCRSGLDLLRNFRHKHGAHVFDFEEVIFASQGLMNNKDSIEIVVTAVLNFSESLASQERLMFPDFEQRLAAFVKKHNLSETFRKLMLETPTVAAALREHTPGSIPFLS